MDVDISSFLEGLNLQSLHETFEREQVSRISWLSTDL